MKEQIFTYKYTIPKADCFPEEKFTALTKALRILCLVYPDKYELVIPKGKEDIASFLVGALEALYNESHRSISFRDNY